MAENNKLARLNILLVGKTGVGKKYIDQQYFWKRTSEGGRWQTCYKINQ